MLHLKETQVNQSENYLCYEPYWFETRHEDKGSLFKALQKEHGRCRGRSYRDTEKGAKHVGWVFLKREEYEDSHETFLLETWTEFRDIAPPLHCSECGSVHGSGEYV